MRPRAEASGRTEIPEFQSNLLHFPTNKHEEFSLKVRRKMLPGSGKLNYNVSKTERNLIMFHQDLETYHSGNRKRLNLLDWIFLLGGQVFSECSRDILWI